MTKSQFIRYLIFEAEQAYIDKQNTHSEELKNYYEGAYSAYATAAVEYSGKNYRKLLAKYAPDRLKERIKNVPLQSNSN